MTNTELARIAKDIFAQQKTVYAKGGIGWLLTQDRYDYLYNQYQWNRDHFNSSYLGKHACDCSGMIVGMAYDGWRVNSEPVWSKAHDWNDWDLSEKITGCVSPDKAIEGMCLWKKGHVGLCIGDGWALDADFDASGNGIHKRRISDVNWEKAGKLPEIEYPDDIKVGDIVPMEVYEIKDGYAYGKIQVSVPDEIKVGSKVTIAKGAVSGGGNPKYANKPIDPKYANGKYVDTVQEITTFNGEKQALLKTLYTWVAFKYLTVVG